MKLNNKGWGLAEYLVLASVLMIALLIAAIYTVRLNKGIEQSNTILTNTKELRKETKADKKALEEKDNTSSTSTTTESNSSSNTRINNNENYITIEGNMVTTAQKLVNNEKITISNDILIVKDEHLFEQDETLKSEMNSYNCKGYIKIYNKDNSIHYTPYINCDNYTTTGYEKEYE